MRERLLLAFVGLSVFTVLLYGVPRAFLAAEQVRDAQRRELVRTATVLTEVIQARREAGEAVRRDDLVPSLDPSDAVSFTGTDGPEVRAGGPIADSERDLVVRREIDGIGLLELRRAASSVDRRTAEAIVPVVVTGIAVIAVSVVLAAVLARRLARPFQELAFSAQLVGEGGASVDIPDHDLREAAQIAAALRDSARRLHEALDHERQFASDASHQLRTPLTGLRLRLEDLSSWPDLPDGAGDELAACLVEIDRLADTVTELLLLTRAGAIDDAEVADLAEVVDAAVARWQPVADRAGRSLRSSADADVRIWVSPTTLAQVLDVLIENALRHGAGRIDLEACRRNDHVRLAVRDEGAALDVADRVFERGGRGAGSEGAGIGLALAQRLLASVGGRLHLERAAPTTFAVLLPASLVEPSGGHPPGRRTS